MKKTTAALLSSAAMCLASQVTLAGTAPFFVPLTQSAVVSGVDSLEENIHPWLAPAGVSQANLTSMEEIEADVTQSTQRVSILGDGASMFDMLAFDDSGDYLFIPHETLIGAGVSRYDMVLDRTNLIFAGNEAGVGEDFSRFTSDDDWSADFGAFDPARWTPNSTVFAAEEWSGLGRVVEIMDPFATPADPKVGGTELVEDVDYRVLNSFARVSHEGIGFSQKHLNDVIYYIDEDRSGCIYKLDLAEPGNYEKGGQTFVLSVNQFRKAIETGEADSTINWDAGVNATATRHGKARWIAITNKKGKPKTTVDPFSSDIDDPRPGRAACDEVGGTPYGRPEDVAVGMLPNGNEIIYVATTSEAAVISIEEIGGRKAIVREFASEANTAKNEGFLPTTGIMNSPDNLAIDALGNVYIIEDAPNSNSVGGDIWFARDMDNDGVAESLDHFLSLQVAGSEATGMIFNPAKPSQFVVAVQHPDSTDLTVAPEGFGDAIWQFDIQDVVPPTCDTERRDWEVYSHSKKRYIKACSHDRDFNFVKVLDRQRPEFPNP